MNPMTIALRLARGVPLEQPTPTRKTLTWTSILWVKLFITVALFLALSISYGQPGAVRARIVFVTIVYTFCLGNLDLIALFLLSRVTSKVKGWRLLLLLLGASFAIGTIGSLVSSLIVWASGFVPKPFLVDMLSGAFKITLVVNSVMLLGFLLYDRMRGRLEAENLELQKEVAIGSARRHEQDEDFQKAHEIQQDLLPKSIAQIQGCNISGIAQPALAVGGDYYDAVRFSESAIGIAIGDVIGKGISAALLMATLQATFRAYSASARSPSEVCDKINQVMCMNIAVGKFITFFYAIIDMVQRRVTYCNCGHNAPLLLRRSGDLIRLDEGGALLGVFPHGKYEQQTVALDSGDRILLFTDGVTEAENETAAEFGLERLVQVLRTTRGLSSGRIQSAVLRSVTKFCNGHFSDDVTLVVVAVR